VRLRYGPCITVAENAKAIERDGAGIVTKIKAKVLADTLGGKNPSDGTKVHGVIHWVDAATSVPAEVRLYEQLFKTAKPEEGGGNFLEQIVKNSLNVMTGARVEASLAKAAVGSRWQFERVGYFIVDPDTKAGAGPLVFNRIITLRESHATPEAEVAVTAAPQVAVTNPKAERRKSSGKGKSGPEYRAETRARDPELAKWHDQIAATPGVTAEQADLLTADRETAQLFLGAAKHVGFPEIVAKWIVNELPRALGDRELADANLGADRFGELIAAIGELRLPAPAAKQALAEMIATGKRLRDVEAATRGGEVIGVAELGTRAEALIAANPDKAAQVKAGKHGLLGFFVGQLIKAAPGADPKTVNEVLRMRLGLPAE
jgi:glutaminyl-tRNA synthetase